MSLTRRFAPLIVCLVGSLAWAQEFSAEALLGEWEFAAYAERSTPDQRTRVGVIFEFRPNGVMITKMSTGDVESQYSVDGDTLSYSGEGGDQTWIVRSFEPDESIVMENDSVIMYLERR